MATGKQERSQKEKVRLTALLGVSATFVLNHSQEIGQSCKVLQETNRDTQGSSSVQPVRLSLDLCSLPT